MSASASCNLNASALDPVSKAVVPGNFVYNPAEGTVLSAGQQHTLSTTFTPDDLIHYFNISANVLINVIQATLTITWSNPADIVYRTPLSSTQLDATASVPGTFIYTLPAGTVLSVGKNQPLTITFKPTNSIDYTTATDTVYINVNGSTAENENCGRDNNSGPGNCGYGGAVVPMVPAPMMCGSPMCSSEPPMFGSEPSTTAAPSEPNVCEGKVSSSKCHKDKCALNKHKHHAKKHKAKKNC